MDISDFKTTSAVTGQVVAMPTSNALPPGVAPSEPEAAAEEQPAVQETVAESKSADKVADAVESSAKDESPASNPKLSSLIRKEAALHKERERIKAEKAAIEEAARQVKQFEEVKTKAKLDPISALQAMGLTYEEITEYVMNGNKPTANAEVQAVRDEITRLREEQEQSRKQAEKAAEERVNQEYESVIEEFRQNAVNYVKTNSDKYELTSIYDGASLVYEVVEQHFADTQKLMSVEEAAQLVEQYFEGVADRVVASKKIQARVASKAVAETNSAPKAAASTPAPKKTTTLSNQLTASTASTMSKPRTESDRIRAALARLNDI